VSARIRGNAADASDAAAANTSYAFRALETVDRFFTPINSIIFYILNLSGTILISWCYYLFEYEGSADWFRAAIRDNYTFFAILVYPLLIAYVQLTQDIDDGFRDTIVVLAGRRILQAIQIDAGEPRLVPLRLNTRAPLQELDRIEAAARRVGERVGVVILGLLGVVLIALGLAALLNLGMSSPEIRSAKGGIPGWFLAALAVLHLPLALPLAYQIGSRLMRLVYYGAAVYQHERHGVLPVPVLGHSDQAGGLKPLGDYFLGQAYRACLISGYLIAAALFLVTNDPITNIMIPSAPGLHEHLTWVFVGLALLIVGMQLADVVLPLWTVHDRMVAYKRSLMGRAAIMTRRRQRLLRRLARAEAETDSHPQEDAQLVAVERWIDDYEALPTWPVPFNSFRTFWIMWSGSIAAAIGMLIRAIIPK
jgi:hypothetical protein